MSPEALANILIIAVPAVTFILATPPLAYRYAKSSDESEGFVLAIVTAALFAAFGVFITMLYISFFIDPQIESDLKDEILASNKSEISKGIGSIVDLQIEAKGQGGKYLSANQLATESFEFKDQLLSDQQLIVSTDGNSNSVLVRLTVQNKDDYYWTSEQEYRTTGSILLLASGEYLPIVFKSEKVED